LRKFFLSLFLLVLIFISWPFIDKQLEKTNIYPAIDSIKTELSKIKENPYISSIYDKVYNTFNLLTENHDIGIPPIRNQEQERKEIEKPNLVTPSEHVFSINNIVLGEKKEAVEQKLGVAQRSTLNEYGTEWNAYHENYQNFVLVAYDEKNEVDGLFTNQDLIASSIGISLGTSKEKVLQQLGEPLKQIQKGMVYFQFQKDRDYDVFHIDNSYLTVFYDKHNNNSVTSLQIINEQLEQNKNDFYAKASAKLKEGFEYQLFDLTNADRAKHQLSILQWDERVKETARDHSMDMAKNNYFSHTNLKGLSPFKRMENDGIAYSFAGENLASGQFSSIFAHEGLMNSLGHRENILRPEYQFLGVGVAFNSKFQPYYTENFFAK